MDYKPTECTQRQNRKQKKNSWSQILKGSRWQVIEHAGDLYNNNRLREFTSVWLEIILISRFAHIISQSLKHWPRPQRTRMTPKGKWGTCSPCVVVPHWWFFPFLSSSFLSSREPCLSTTEDVATPDSTAEHRTTAAEWNESWSSLSLLI